jgi:hypothetical protein
LHEGLKSWVGAQRIEGRIALQTGHPAVSGRESFPQAGTDAAPVQYAQGGYEIGRPLK